MITLRPYQVKLARQGCAILKDRGVLYLAAEMRVGKTLIALEIARLYGAKFVLFLSKKMALASIVKDHREAGYKYRLVAMNYEAIHKVDVEGIDFIVCDEAHLLGAFPKKSKKTKLLKEIVGDLPYVLLSGTPSPESYSQLYHQLWPSINSPWNTFANFYEWVNAGYVRPRLMKISGYQITDYSHADKQRIEEDIIPFFLTFTQKEAKFQVAEVKDRIIEVPTPSRLKGLIGRLVEERVYFFRNGDTLVCDTAVSLQNKVHQLCSGTVITEEGGRILETFKADFIKQQYRGKKIAVFYLFDMEGKVLEATFPCWTRDPAVFRSIRRSVFISQFQSGSHGIDLSVADVIIFYNIHFSSELYQQARQRGQTKDKTTATEIHWLFSEEGIEHNVYNAVMNKQDYTLSYFRKDFLT